MIHTLIAAIRNYLAGDGALILPEMELVLFALGIVQIDRWLTAKEKSLNAVLALAGIGFSGFTLYLQHGKIHVLQQINPESPGLLGFHQSLLADHFFLYFAALFLMATALTVLLCMRQRGDGTSEPGWCYSLLLFACAGMMLMASGVDLIVVIAGLSAAQLSCFFLIGFPRTRPRSLEAALKYAVVSVSGLSILACGSSLLYRMLGTSNLGRISAVLDLRLERGIAAGGLTGWAALLAMSLIAAGVLLQCEALTFPKWLADAYEEARPPISAFVSIAMKAAGFVLLFRLVLFLFGYQEEKWTDVFAGVALAALLWGNFAAVRQTNLKRLLAYSSIAHSGFLLLGLVASDDTGFMGMGYYLFAYLFMTAGAFAVLTVLGTREEGCEQLTDLDGLYKRSPMMAMLLILFMASLAGLPATAGFLGKYYIVKALILTRHPVLAAIAVAALLPGLYYYSRVVLHAFQKTPVSSPSPAVSGAHAIALTAAAFVTLAAGLYPEPFAQLARYAFGS